MSESSRRRLLLAVDVYPDGGGISTMIESVVDALRADYEVDLAIVDARPGSEAELRLPVDRIHRLGSRSVVKPQLMPTSLVYTLRAGRALRRLVRRLDPDALLVQDGIFLPVPGLLAVRGTRTKLVVMDHGTVANILDPRWQRMFPRQIPFPKSLAYRTGFALDRPWRAARWRLGFRRADEVWYRASELLPLIDRTGARARRYGDIVPAGFAPPTAEQRSAARRRLEVPGDATVVNVVTRLAGEKGLPLIVDGLDAVAPAHPSLLVLVAGDGPLEDWLRDEARRRRLPVRFLGCLDRREVERVHHASDFHLYAGEIACGVTVALLEAMAAGVVPVVSDVPREHVDLVGDAGWVFPAGELAALERSLSQALETTVPERERLSALAVERISEHRGPTLAELAADLLGPARPARPRLRSALAPPLRRTSRIATRAGRRVARRRACRRGSPTA